MSEPASAADLCTEVLRRARANSYEGWDPYDALNSVFIPSERLPWLLRLIAIHAVKRSPVNLRIALGVPKERNPKGIALFAMAYLNRYATTGERRWLAEAEQLLGWLRANRSPAFDQPSWGYNFDWQNGRKFFLRAYHPSIVVSVFCARAFLKHHTVTGDPDSLSTAVGTCDFIRSNIGTRRVAGHETYTYTPDDSFVVVNANALAASLFARTAALADDDELADRARDLLNFVVSMQADDGAWFYAVPAEQSHLSHDNFHTGFVLESLNRCLRAGTGDSEVRAAYERGLGFYRGHLFERDGAPKFEHDRPYPHDVHAAAQAIVTFIEDGREESLTLAADVVEWSRKNLYDERGYFYRCRGRFIDDTTPYVRWSQAWMAYALSAFAGRTDGASNREIVGRL